jgi:hypothetical protein
VPAWRQTYETSDIRLGTIRLLLRGIGCRRVLSKPAPSWRCSSGCYRAHELSFHRRQYPRSAVAMFPVRSTVRQRQNLRVRLWFFARLQARTSLLWRPDGVHVFRKRKAHSLPNHLDSGDRAPPAKAVRNHRSPRFYRFASTKPGRDPHRSRHARPPEKSASR